MKTARPPFFLIRWASIAAALVATGGLALADQGVPLQLGTSPGSVIVQSRRQLSPPPPPIQDPFADNGPVSGQPTPIVPNTGTESGAGSVAALCTGTFAGEFTPGSRSQLVIFSPTAFSIDSPNSHYDAHGRCAMASADSAEIKFALDGYSDYVFVGQIQLSPEGEVTMRLREYVHGQPNANDAVLALIKSL